MESWDELAAILAPTLHRQKVGPILDPVVSPIGVSELPYIKRWDPDYAIELLILDIYDLLMNLGSSSGLDDLVAITHLLLLGCDIAARQTTVRFVLFVSI